MSGHTPGPWRVDGKIVRPGDNGHPRSAPIAYCDCSLGIDEAGRADQANARLIAAAPDLLAALRDVLPFAQAAIGLPEALWPSDSVILKARAALDASGDIPAGSLSSKRPVPFPSEEDRLHAEIERLRALVGEMREALASICDPGLRPCAENFENARARAAKVLRTGDAALGPTDASRKPG